MAHRQGYGFRFRNQYCLSLSTGVQPDGTREFYLHTVGADTHQHVYYTADESGMIHGGGTRLKSEGSHLRSGRSFQGGTTHPFARVAITWDPSLGQPERVELADITEGSSAVSAAPSESRRRSSRDLTWVDLPGSTEVDESVYEFSVVDVTTMPSTGDLVPK